MSQPCQLEVKVTAEGQLFEHLIHYYPIRSYIMLISIDKMVSLVRRCTELMSPLSGLKVKVIISCPALNHVHLTPDTYLPKLKEMHRKHIHGRS